MTSFSPILSPGALFAGDFELLRLLGEGGMGVVWLARERSLDREVALKIMRPSDGSARLQRFAREARALAALDHPSILPVLHTATDEDTGLPYLVTRAILLSHADIHHLCHDILRSPLPRGFDSSLVTRHSSLVTAAATPPAPLSLADLLEGGKQLPEAAVLRIARDLAGALSAAHAAGILHRDLKPSNILFEASGRAILSDFGLAKFTSAAAASARGSGGGEPDAAAASARGSGGGEPPDRLASLSLDESGRRKFLGSPAYAAPEQFRDGAPLTPALDWYAFGAVLHEALTGERPRALRPLSSYAPGYLSRAWDPLLSGLLEPDPVRRLSDPAAILRALDRIARHPARPRWRRWLWLEALLCFLALLGAFQMMRSRTIGSDGAPDGLLGDRPLPPERAPAAPEPAPAAPEEATPAAQETTLAEPEAALPPAPVSRSPDSSGAVPGVRGVVADASLPNPVSDFSCPRTDSAPWLSVPASLPAGTERRLPLGSEPDRLRLLWCPPKPGVAPEGFWILAEPISAELAAAIHNHFAENRTTPVWRTEDGSGLATFDRKTQLTFVSNLSILSGLYGKEKEEVDAPVAHFTLPTNAQLYYARSVCSHRALAIPDVYPWTKEIAAHSASDAFSPVFMSLQPILVRAAARGSLER